MLGSCFVGSNIESMEVFIEDTNIKWIGGYASSAEWFESTLVDCSILRGMLTVDESDYEDEDAMVVSFANSIYCFDENFVIGDDYKGNPITLRESLKLVIQKKGRGSRSKNVSNLIFE